MAALEAEMCGARNGRRRMSPKWPVVLPATDQILLVTDDSSRVIGGRMPAIAFAIELLPEPGAPMKILLCASFRHSNSLFINYLASHFDNQSEMILFALLREEIPYE